MQRDLAELRDFEISKNKESFDIIYKKNKIREILESDPDVLEVLGKKVPRPLNKFKDEAAPTEEELALRTEILKYNASIEHRQILPYLRLDGLQDEVLNFIMFDISDSSVSTMSNIIKNQYVTFMCMVHPDDVETEYDILRMDLLSYLIKDLFCWTNSLGMQMKCESDIPDVIDKKYHCRTLRFKIEAPNSVSKTGGNKYDRFVKI